MIDLHTLRPDRRSSVRDTYSRALALDLGAPPSHAALRHILQLLGRPARR